MIKFDVYWVSVYFVEELGMSFSIGKTWPYASQKYAATKFRPCFFPVAKILALNTFLLIYFRRFF